MDTNEMIGLRDAAETLGVHYMTAYRYVRTGALPAVQHEGRWWVDADDLTRFAAERDASPARPGRPPADAPARLLESLTPRQNIALADRLVEGDQGGAWRIIEHALRAGADIRRLNAALLTPALARIGESWASGALTIADEHRATVVAQRLIARLGRHFTPPGRRGGTVVLSAMTGDRHALPSAIVADVLRAEGLSVVDLGADTPVDDIIGIAQRQDRLVAVGICATSPLDRTRTAELVEAVGAIRRETGRPVLLGGRSVTDAVAERATPDHCSRDADDAVDWLLDVARS